MDGASSWMLESLVVDITLGLGRVEGAEVGGGGRAPALKTRVENAENVAVYSSNAA